MLLARPPRFLRPKRVLVLAFALLILATAAYFARHRLRLPQGAIPARGGKSMHVLLTGLEPYYLQRDPRWAGDMLSPTRQTLSAVGCLVSSLAMGSEALGAPVDPGALNRRLGAAGGYTREAWVIWDKVPVALGHDIAVTVLPRPAHAALDEALERGDLLIVKFTLPNGAPHWVLVVGKEGDEYLVKDPLLIERSIVKLASRARAIESVRVLRRVSGGW